MPRKRPLRGIDDGVDRWQRAGFVEWLKLRNSSQATLKTYRSSVEQFVRWCEDRSLTSPETITRSHVQSYQRWLYYFRIAGKEDTPERGLTVPTQLFKLTAVRSYFQFLVKRGHLALSPATDLELPKQPQTLPRAILQPSEIEAMLVACDLNTPLGLRDRTMIETLYSTGLRRAELCSLRLVDIDWHLHTAMVRQGKGHKDRVVPLGQRSLHWVTKYLVEARPQLVTVKDPGVVFLTQGGTAMEPDTLTALIKKYLQRAHLEAIEGGCHLLRHACATHMLEGGADIRYVQELLGHSNLNTTQRYTRVSIRKLKEVHARSHPAELQHSQQAELQHSQQAELAAEQQSYLQMLALER